jgi:hypothetical protein
MIEITLNPEGLQKLIDLWPQAPQQVDRHLRTAMEKAVLVLQEAAVEEAPVGAYGILSSSIYHEVEQSAEGITGTVSTGPEGYYGLFVHGGTDPHWVPIEALKPWARVKLGDENLAYPVRKKIGAVGTDPNPFMQRAADQEEARINSFFDAELAVAIRGIGI